MEGEKAAFSRSVDNARCAFIQIKQLGITLIEVNSRETEKLSDYSIFIRWNIDLFIDA